MHEYLLLQHCSCYPSWTWDILDKMKSRGALCRVLYWTDYIEPTGVFRIPVNGTAQPDAVVSGQLQRPTALAINFTGKQIVDSLSQHATFSCRICTLSLFTSVLYCLNCSVETESFLNVSLRWRSSNVWETVQGSHIVTTCLSCGGIVYHNYVANLLLNLSVNEFWKSVNFGKVMGKITVACFLTDSVYLYILNAVRCPYIRTSVTVGLAKRMASQWEWRHNENGGCERRRREETS